MAKLCSAKDRPLRSIPLPFLHADLARGSFSHGDSSSRGVGAAPLLQSLGSSID
ncbi:hypothetical protein M6B38_363820 [Iris pallida]|uniref:Uncharacterized protein n=1 Tax=Iris pallida TaxID=29817 RepID=A0AAX6F567_IRIPA|nr:hypothetical protein M6B38_153260 [Iris pallida]KAJ6828298.1 hypothetical protein M6B38_363820 [Iris pallida]